jgi:hypothetical protein
MRLIATLLLGVIPAIAQQQGFYQFAIDQDRLSGAPDFSFLNHPLNASDRLFVRDGHFYRVGRDLKPGTGDDQRVRLFGHGLLYSLTVQVALPAAWPPYSGKLGAHRKVAGANRQVRALGGVRRTLLRRQSVHQEQARRYQSECKADSNCD